MEQDRAKNDNPLAAGGTVDGDVHCRTCGYNLRTLRTDGKCPECGTDVAWTLRPEQLAFADARWVALVRFGAGLSGLGSVLIFWGGWLGSDLDGRSLTIMDVSVVVLAIGAWFMGWPEPVVPTPKQARTCQRMRRAYAGAVGLMALRAVWDPVYDWWFPGGGWRAMCDSVADEVLGMMTILFIGRGVLSHGYYMGLLACRVPCAWLVWFARFVTWTLPVLIATYALADLDYWQGESKMTIDKYSYTWWSHWYWAVMSLWGNWLVCGVLFLSCWLVLSRRSTLAPRLATIHAIESGVDSPKSGQEREGSGLKQRY
jgi:hypothetical protein